ATSIQCQIGRRGTTVESRMGSNGGSYIRRDDDRSDLPTLREEVRDLPVLIPGSGARYEPVKVAAFPDWSNRASQRHISSLALSPMTGDLWLATAGGVLRWHADLKTFTRYTSEHGLPGNATTGITV